jgi:dihydrolipoamide dehydrogenase
LYAAQALSLEAVPQRLAVVGAGYIGLELGQAYARLGAKVTLVEAQASILPIWDQALTRPLATALAADNLELLLNARALGYTDGVLAVEHTEGAATPTSVEADKVLVAVGRRANLDGWGFENLAIEAAAGFIEVSAHCETSMSGVYAIGDLTGEPMLAHRAMAQATMVAEHLAGRRRRFSPAAIPAICFTDPEIVSVGMSPAEASANYAELCIERFPLTGNARSLTLGAGQGFVRVIARADDHVLLGVQAVGHQVAELVHGFTLALEMGARLEDVADCIHAHPTIGESFGEAVSAALGLPLHA